MIFNVPNHISMIQNGLASTFIRDLYPDMIIKTQTRRLNRGIYKVGKDYAVQRKRGVKSEPDIRIVFDRIWEETPQYWCGSYYGFCISQGDARAEGNYSPKAYEELFRELNPKWDGWSRWAFVFHVIEIYTNEEKEIYREFNEAQKELDHARDEKLERSLKHLHREIIEHIHPYVTTKIEKVLK